MVTFEIREFVGMWEKLLHLRRMYSPTHEVYEKALTDVSVVLGNILAHREVLEFQIREDEILYEGHSIYKKPLQEENIAFVFYRDGVRKLIFKKHILFDELRTFFEILYRGWSRSQYEEEDIVSLLWVHEFQGIEYEAVEPLDYEDKSVRLENERILIEERIVEEIRMWKAQEPDEYAHAFPVQHLVLRQWREFGQERESDKLMRATDLATLDTAEEVQVFVLDVLLFLADDTSLWSELEKVFTLLFERAWEKGDIQTIVFMLLQLEMIQIIDMHSFFQKVLKFSKVHRYVRRVQDEQKPVYSYWKRIFDFIDVNEYLSALYQIDSWPSELRKPLEERFFSYLKTHPDELHQLIEIELPWFLRIILRAIEALPHEEKHVAWTLCITRGCSFVKREAILSWCRTDSDHAYEGWVRLFRFPEEDIWVPFLETFDKWAPFLYRSFSHFRPDVMRAWPEALLEKFLYKMADHDAERFHQSVKKWAGHWKLDPASIPVLSEVLSFRQGEVMS